MKTNNQTGLSTVHIIAILAALAVLFGVISTMSSSDDSSAAATAETTSGAQEIAQNIAENKAETAVDAIAQNQEQLQELVEDLPPTPASDTTEEVMEKDESGVVTQEPTLTPVVAPEPEPTPAPAPVATSEPTPEPVVAASGTFTDYDPSLLVAGETNVLFFHATWCPSCRGLENDLNANLSAIPAGVNILKLDYDTETELKQEYGVIRQHTLVVVDGNGVEIKKLNGLTNTLEQVINQL